MEGERVLVALEAIETVRNYLWDSFSGETLPEDTIGGATQKAGEDLCACLRRLVLARAGIGEMP